MGILKYMKKIIGVAWREVDNTTFQQRAIKKADKIAHGEKVIAPKHPTDQRIFESAIKNETIKEEVSKKYDKLIEHMNKITITSTDLSHKTFPTNYSLLKENSHDKTQTFEYGFYEPPIEKMEKDHLTFKEALNILRAKVEIESDVSKKDPKIVESNVAFLENHPATKRVNPVKLHNVWRYFRPFVRQEKQRVLLKKDIDDLKQIMESKTDFSDFYQNPKEMIKNLLKAKRGSKLKMSLEEDHFELLEQEEELKMVEAMREKRREDFERLEKRLIEIKELEAEVHDQNKEEKSHSKK